MRKYRAKACFFSIVLRSFLHGFFGCCGTVDICSSIFIDFRLQFTCLPKAFYRISG